MWYNWTLIVYVYIYLIFVYFLYHKRCVHINIHWNVRLQVNFLKKKKSKPNSSNYKQLLYAHTVLNHWFSWTCSVTDFCLFLTRKITDCSFNNNYKTWLTSDEWEIVLILQNDFLAFYIDSWINKKHHLCFLSKDISQNNHSYEWRMYKWCIKTYVPSVLADV